GKSSDFKKQSIYSSESNLKNDTDLLQNMNTNAFSQSETLTNTTTTTQNWFAQGSFSFTAGVEVGDEEGKASFSTTIGITSGGGGSHSQTCTYSVTNTVSAPPQNIMVPPHTEAVARWVLEKVSGNENFSFYAPIVDQKAFPFYLAGLMVKNADEWHHLGSPQQHQDAQILDSDLVELDLYSLLSSVGTHLPMGITKRDDGKFYMSGAGMLKAEGLGGLELEVVEYPLDGQGNKTGAPPTIQHYPVQKHMTLTRLHNAENPCT
ncbi:MAG: ETX/MTX2 family pore-forming toxin, partial [Enterobacteriaceae bacterium]